MVEHIRVSHRSWNSCAPYDFLPAILHLESTREKPNAILRIHILYAYLVIVPGIGICLNDASTFGIAATFGERLNLWLFCVLRGVVRKEPHSQFHLAQRLPTDQACNIPGLLIFKTEEARRQLKDGSRR